MDRLKDRAAIVTGAASGIGRASAELFAAEGARVLAVDRPGTKLVFEDKAIATLASDISSQDAPAAIVTRAIDAFGRLDILYNNAGVSGGYGGRGDVRRGVGPDDFGQSARDFPPQP